MASKWLSSPLARLVFLTGGTVLLTLGISRDENEWLWIGGFLIALTIYLFYSSQKQLREKSWLMLEAIRNRDYSFRLPTHGFIGGERILQNALNEFGAMNEVYGEFFAEPYPARAAFQVAALPKNARVEIEAVAVKR